MEFWREDFLKIVGVSSPTWTLRCSAAGARQWQFECGNLSSANFVLREAPTL